MIVVLDSGPVIHLSWLDHLDLLERQFEEVFVPPAVRDEVLRAPAGTLGLEGIQHAFAQGWLSVRLPARDVLDPAAIRKLGAGETEAFLLADELRAALFITDDATARAEALRRGFEVTGSLGVLTGARQRGLIPAVLPLLLELRRLGQWVSDDLVDTIRRQE